MSSVVQIFKVTDYNHQSIAKSLFSTLLPEIFQRLYECVLPTEQEIKEKKLSEMSHEKREKELFSVYKTVLEANAPETLKKLLHISGTSLFTKEKRMLAFMLEDIEYNNKIATDYEECISVLINACGAVFSEAIPGYMVQDFKYSESTALHFLCRFKMQKPALLLIEKLAEAGNSLNDICIKSFSQNHPQAKTRYYYTALHLAIENNLPEVAIKLIEQGADITQAMVYEHPTTYCCGFFSKIVKEDKTPLKMAIEQRQVDVIRAIQLRMLENYIVTREQEEEYLSHITIYDHTLIRFGRYHKDVKLKVAKELLKDIRNGDFDHESLEQHFSGPLNQGRLGEIRYLSKIIIMLSAAPHEHTAHL